ncbi:MAG TPA: PAS domain-containing sensor histidine kinase [Candidatus Paceibacterota bacterium]|nr:PAS domain-containing sensor histidine kinase [Candidatus Paceibacterota bacterium]
MIKNKPVENEHMDLRWVKARADAVLESLGEGLVVVDKEGKILLLNRTAGEMTGWRPDEVTGEKFLEDVLPKENEAGERIQFKKSILQEVLKGKKITINALTPYWMVRRDGTRFPISITVSPVSIDGDVIGAVEVFRDISKEHELETAKNEFISLASHQLRTPLSTVSWYTEMLLAGDVGEITEEQKRYLGEIYVGNNRMINLVNALLNVSRIETSTIFIGNEPVDVAKVIDDVLSELEPLIEEKKHTIDKHYKDKKIPILRADKSIIHIIIQNLILNAVKYTGENGTITIDLESKQGLTLIVKDTGYGIQKNQQNQIFTKLFRADNIQGIVTDGTGLGLYMVKKILEKLGGKIWFESEENKGSTFYVNWPASGMREQRGTTHLISGQS